MGAPGAVRRLERLLAGVRTGAAVDAVAATGIPAPTTGGTSSLLALLDGRWADSLRLNAMMLPIAALYAASLGALTWQWIAHGRARLPGIFLPAWIAVLGVAWVFKLIL